MARSYAAVKRPPAPTPSWPVPPAPPPPGPPPLRRGGVSPARPPPRGLGTAGRRPPPAARAAPSDAGGAVKDARRRGRGAQSNAPGRYEPLARIAFDDGWQSFE